jgi:hypothetical protein
MELTDRKWGAIRDIFLQAFNSSFHYSIATVNEDGSPHVTPIGSLILRDDCTGFYFEEYTSNLSKNLLQNKRICVMAVNTAKWPMLKSFFLGKFIAPPGVRLMGTAAERREATPEERDQFRRRVRKYRMFKGHDLLWSKLRHVREIRFDSYEPIRIGGLTRDAGSDT